MKFSKVCFPCTFPQEVTGEQGPSKRMWKQSKRSRVLEEGYNTDTKKGNPRRPAEGNPDMTALKQV